MTEQFTAEEIAARFAALVPSVKLVNALSDEVSPYIDTLDDLRRNVDHLTQMRVADYWTNEDFTAVDAAIITGENRISEVEDNGATRPPTHKMVRVEAARRLRALAGTYTPEERETWAAQVDEAKALVADENATAPLVTALAAADNITPVTMAGYILGHNSAFATASGKILAAQRAILAMDPLPADFATRAEWTA